VFCAGADLKERALMDDSETIKTVDSYKMLFNKIDNVLCPSIALIHGYALGGGCELLLSCHLRICSDSAKFGQPEVGLGLIAGFGGTQRLPRLIGKGAAFKMLLSGEIIDSNEALRIGLVDKIAENLDEEVHLLSLKISHNSPKAIAKTLESVNRGVELCLEEALLIESDLFSKTFEDYDSKEGMDAFINKRKPTFKDIK